MINKALSITIVLSILSGLAIVPALALEEPILKYPDGYIPIGDSPSDKDQGYGNDPGNSGEAHKNKDKRDGRDDK